MTVSTTQNRVSYAGNGVTSAFSFPYIFFDNADLVVLNVKADGTYTRAVLGTDYTVAGAGVDAGGTVTMTTAPAVGTTLVIYRDPAMTQPQAFVDNDPLPAKSVSRGYDRLTLIGQRLRELVDRSFRLSDSDTSGASPVLPSPTPNAFIGWNGVGNGLVNRTITDLITISAYGTAVADKFVGDGTTKDFTLSANPGALGNLDVSIGGITQMSSRDFTWDGNTKLSFVSAPPSPTTPGDTNIYARYLRALPQGTLDLAIATFTAASAGAVARSALDKLREVAVSVMDYGADPTGVVDSSAAFTNAIATGRPVRVPAGTYLANIVIQRAGVALIGDGKEATLIKNFSDAPIITITNGAGAVRNTRVHGLQLCNRNKAVYTSAHGIYINGANPNLECDFGIFSDLQIFQMKHGVHMDARSIWNRWDNVSIVESIEDNFVANATDNQAIQLFVNCRFAAAGRYALFANHTFASFLLTGWTFTNCNFENNLSVPLRVTGTQGIQNWTFTGCYTEENVSSIAVGGSGGVLKVGFMWLDCPYAFGLSMKNSTFMGNTSVADPDYYIYVGDACVNVTGEVDLCRFDSAGVRAIYWQRNVYVGNNQYGANGGAVIDRTQGAMMRTDATTVVQWTPVLNFSGGAPGVAYSVQAGRYQVIGRTVVFSLTVRLTSKGTGSGSAVVMGLPFVSINHANLDTAVSVVSDQMTVSGVVGKIKPGTSEVALYTSATGTLTATDFSQFGNFTILNISGSYFI
jgi:hypothetical protein